MNEKGFTLIELLVVVLIIGILAAIALPQYRVAVIKSRYSNLKAMTRSIADAEEIHYLANGNYTFALEDLGVLPDGKLNTSTTTKIDYSWGSCSFYIDGDGQAKIFCSNTDQLRYEIYLLHSAYLPGGRKCVVLNSSGTSDIRHQVCKNETGDTGNGATDDESNVFRTYR